MERLRVGFRDERRFHFGVKPSSSSGTSRFQESRLCKSAFWFVLFGVNNYNDYIKLQSSENDCTVQAEMLT